MLRVARRAWVSSVEKAAVTVYGLFTCKRSAVSGQLSAKQQEAEGFRLQAEGKTLLKRTACGLQPRPADG